MHRIGIRLSIPIGGIVIGTHGAAGMIRSGDWVTIIRILIMDIIIIIIRTMLGIPITVTLIRGDDRLAEILEVLQFQVEDGRTIQQS